MQPLKKRYSFTIAFVIIALLVMFVLVLMHLPSVVDSRGQRAAREVVLNFGDVLKNVPLTGTSDIAQAAIRQNYTDYVTPELLALWVKKPTEAPGRLTSSPSPDHIEITSISKQGSGYVVSGNIIETTSAGDATPISFVAVVVKVGSEWKIAAFQEQSTS